MILRVGSPSRISRAETTQRTGWAIVQPSRAGGEDGWVEAEADSVRRHGMVQFVVPMQPEEPLYST
jgi:hypothetical protein